MLSKQYSTVTDITSKAKDFTLIYRSKTIFSNIAVNPQPTVKIFEKNFTFHVS